MELSPKYILTAFVIFECLRYFAESYLSKINRNYYLNPENQKKAIDYLKIEENDLIKSISYASDKFHFGRYANQFNFLATMMFLLFGGFGYFEKWAGDTAQYFNSGSVVQGLFFFIFLSIAGSIISIPISWYSTFVIEEKHGFNRQTKKGFVSDLIKSTLVSMLLGLPLLAGLLYIIENAGDFWWVWAWALLTVFSLIASWLYPSLLAPIFNKFTELSEGSLREKIYALAEKVGFPNGGIFSMDASKRSSHGNAYFTGVFGKKRIVLFDTLTDTLAEDETVAVLAHELGHFKLGHIRKRLIRSVLMSLLFFYILSVVIDLTAFYNAFYLKGVSSYGALIVFGQWFSLVSFFIEPIENHNSRKDEFEADAFAKKQMDDNPELLVSGLLKLREKSKSVPITHPLFSRFYYSHPPMIERLEALRK